MGPIDGRDHERTALPAAWEVGRLQAFSDAVFALAATLLVVTLEIPASYDDLVEALAAFPAFGLAFAALVSLWWSHRQFFAVYPLGDGWTVALNSLLLFVVLLYVYPLKLLSEVAAERYLGAAPDVTIGMGRAETQGLFLAFGAAVLAVALVFAGLHLRAWRLRDALGLDAAGRFELLREAAEYAAVCVVAGLSLAAAGLGLGLAWALPLWLYVLGPVAVGALRLLTSGRRMRLGERRGRDA